MPHEAPCELYSTGQIAEACSVSVRTVQYYDEKGLLHPTERTEGGRRLYDEEALNQMKRICLLKSLGLSLRAIKGILQYTQGNAELLCLLEEQQKVLTAEIEDKQRTLEQVRLAIQEIKATGRFPSNATKGIDSTMKKQKTQLQRTMRRLLIEGIIVDLFEYGTLIYAISTGQWLAFICVLAVTILFANEAVHALYHDVAYKCPHCHTIFKPTLKEFTFAPHTRKTRKLTCPHCTEKSWCTEVSVDTLSSEELQMLNSEHVG